MEPDFLNNIGAKTPFEVPEGYFGALNKEIMDRVDKENEQFTIPGAAAGNIFLVPADYFGKSREQLLTRVNSGGTERSAGRTFTRFAQTAIAACFVLILSVLSILQVEKQSNSNDSFLNIVNFDEEILVQEYLNTYNPVTEKQGPDIETYILNQVDESLILQEL